MASRRPKSKTSSSSASSRHRRLVSSWSCSNCGGEYRLFDIPIPGTPRFSIELGEPGEPWEWPIDLKRSGCEQCKRFGQRYEALFRLQRVAHQLAETTIGVIEEGFRSDRLPDLEQSARKQLHHEIRKAIIVAMSSSSQNPDREDADDFQRYIDDRIRNTNNPNHKKSGRPFALAPNRRWIVKCYRDEWAELVQRLWTDARVLRNTGKIRGKVGRLSTNELQQVLQPYLYDMEQKSCRITVDAGIRAARRQRVDRFCNLIVQTGHEDATYDFAYATLPPEPFELLKEAWAIDILCSDLMTLPRMVTTIKLVAKSLDVSESTIRKVLQRPSPPTRSQ